MMKKLEKIVLKIFAITAYNNLNDQVRGGWLPSKTDSFIFNMAAGCKMKMKRIRTLIISSIKFLFQGALHWASIGRNVIEKII
jgi:hypothetical protein